MHDRHGRALRYLRVSVTDRCNLRCVYCMPPEGIPLVPPSEVLRYEEIVRLVRIAICLGLTRLRLTGGEPLVRRDIVNLVAELARLPGLEDLSLTTNGTLLASQARALREAGLRRVNISLDTLRPEAYARITRRGNIEQALGGIEAALAAGLEPVKINAVLVARADTGGLDGAAADVAAFADRTRRRPLHVRFIEEMAVGQAPDSAFVSGAWVRERLAALGPLEPAAGPPGNGPATYYRLPGAAGTVGLINARSEHFCLRCNRLRLTATGALRFCLFPQGEIDLREPLRRGDEAAVIAAFRQAVSAKPAARPEHYDWHGAGMCQIGG